MTTSQRKISGWSLFCKDHKDNNKVGSVRELWKTADKKYWQSLANKSNETLPTKNKKSKIIDSKYVDLANARVLFVVSGNSVKDWDTASQDIKNEYLKKAKEMIDKLI
jgi:hypothetical protein